jgi:integrase
MLRINEAVKDVMEFLRGVPLSAGTLKNYQRYYQFISSFCESNGIELFDDSAAEMFVNTQKAFYMRGEFATNRFCQLRKSAVLLSDHYQGRTLVWGRRVYGKKMNESFEDALSKFSAHLGLTLSANTCKGTVSVARRFLVYSESCGTNDVKVLTADDVKRFVVHRGQNYPKSMKHILRGVKVFCAFLNSAGISELDASRYLVRPAPSHVKVLPCFTDDEAAAILAAVDCSTSVGKRDYAILKIALGTGLRGVDILGLKKSDIDWDRSVINVLQSKTGTYSQLPLLPDVGNAVAEYILDARPISDSPYIFLRSRMPNGRLVAGHDIINRYLEKAGVDREPGDGKSFHAFRRTVGTRLVKANVPLPSVAQLLIHNDMDSTKRYIALDEDTLRVCCLDISEYSTTKGGLS